MAAVPVRTTWETPPSGSSFAEVFLMAILLVILLEGFAWAITFLRHAARRHRETAVDRKFNDITRNL